MDRLNMAVHCLCDASMLVNLWSPSDESHPYGTAALAEGGKLATSPAIALAPTGPQFGALYMAIQQNYRVIEVTEDEKGPWKVQTLGYRYKITDGEHRELFLWHWEPMSRSPRKRPHMHVKAAHAIENTPISNLHIPTGRVLVEDVVRFLIEELGIAPTTPAWESRLVDNIAAFERGKSWDREPPSFDLTTR